MQSFQEALSHYRHIFFFIKGDPVPDELFRPGTSASFRTSPLGIHSRKISASSPFACSPVRQHAEYSTLQQAADKTCHLIGLLPISKKHFSILRIAKEHHSLVMDSFYR